MIEPKDPPNRLGDMEASLVSPARASASLTHGGINVTSASFAAFYTATYESVARALSITLGDVGWGQEAADEAMTRAYDRWSDVSTYSNPAGWVYRVGLNWARSWHKKLRRKLPTTGEPVALPKTSDHELDAALMSIDIKYRSVVVCRYLLDWSTEDTARALDIAPGTVKSRLSTGLSQLRTALAVPESAPTETNPS